MDFESYADSMKKQGFDQVVERVWKPLTTVVEQVPRTCFAANTARALIPPPLS